MTCNEWNFMTFYCKKQHLNYDNKNMKTSILHALLLNDLFSNYNVPCKYFYKEFGIAKFFIMTAIV